MNLEYDTSKTLEQLENDRWGAPTYSSYLVRTCHALREKPLESFEVEDLRIMIGQNSGLAYLIPLALHFLSKNILAEGDMYEGDLLTNVLRSDKAYWIQHKSNWSQVIDLVENGTQTLKEFDTLDSIKKEWFTFLAEFKTYH